MKIAVLASADRMQAFEKVALNKISWTAVQDTKDCANFDVFFDLNFDLEENQLEKFSQYINATNTQFFISSVQIQLEKLVSETGATNVSNIAGINAIPGFLERAILEITHPFGLEETYKEFLKTIWSALISVESRVGLVTPRIIFMIVNEAFYTLQEGTAEKSDINTAMKLGTNYPFGPFEAVNIFGINNIFNTLQAIYEDTKEERYKICPALKTAYFKDNR